MSISQSDVIFIGIFGLVGVGLYGLLAIRNLIKIVVALQILIKAAILGLVTAGKMSGQIDLGQSLAVTVIVTDTIVAVVGLALAVQVKQRVETLDVQALAKLRG